LVWHAASGGRYNKLCEEWEIASGEQLFRSEHNQFNEPIEDWIDFSNFAAFVDRDGIYQQVASFHMPIKASGFVCDACTDFAREKIVKHDR
jgi:hypothetical protein